LRAKNIVHAQQLKTYNFIERKLSAALGTKRYLLVIGKHHFFIHNLTTVTEPRPASHSVAYISSPYFEHSHQNVGTTVLAQAAPVYTTEPEPAFHRQG
jgi:hypothetical protein